MSPEHPSVVALVNAAFAVVTSAGTFFFAFTDAMGIAIVTGIVSIATSLIAAFFAYKAKNVSESTHKAVNSRIDEFKRIAEELFMAKGVAKERSDEEQRKGAKKEP